MNIKDYKEKIKAIDDNAAKEKRAVYRDFALSNSTVKIGDIVEDHIGKIIVNSIRIYKPSFDEPCCEYLGIILLKSGKPNKKGEKRYVYQGNLKNETP